MGQIETAAGAEGGLKRLPEFGPDPLRPSDQLTSLWVKAMIPANFIVIHSSRIKIIIRLVIIGLLFTPPLIGSFTLFLAGCYLSWHSSLVLGVILATSLMWTFILITMILVLIREVPRLEIGGDGFALLGLGFNRLRKWIDIEGEFVVRFTPLGRGIRYRLTEAFKKSREQAIPREKVGTNEWMLNTFQMSPRQIAELLNEFKGCTCKGG